MTARRVLLYGAATAGAALLVAFLFALVAYLAVRGDMS